MRILIKPKDINRDTPKVRLNLILRGDAARILMELRKKGFVPTYSSCIREALRVFYEKVVEQEIRSARLKALQKSFGEE